MKLMHALLVPAFTLATLAANSAIAGQSDAETKDLLKGAIDPYIPGSERSQFLRASLM